MFKMATKLLKPHKSKVLPFGEDLGGALVFRWGFIVFFVVSKGLFAQTNLVLNPSFEEFVTCPNFYEWKIDSAKHCYSPTSRQMGAYKVSASYFNDACRTVDWRCNCFSHKWDYQVPKTGNAYAGIYTYWDADYINWPDRNSLEYRWENPFWSPDADSTYRQYIGMQLSEPLKKDHLYKVSLYVSTSYGADVPLAVHNIGVYFSANKVENAPKTGGMGRLYYKPQIENTMAQVPLTDSSAWQLIGGEFVAQGGEQYLVIGNFRSTFETEFTERSHRWTDQGPGTDNNDACFTFVDDVSVELIGDVTGVAEQNNKTKGITIAPNPNNGNFIIRSENNLSYLKIVDLSGRLVYEQKTNSQQVELNNLNLSKGVYILHTKDSEQKEQISKLFISNE
jgi:hypothetical protein